MKMVNLAMTKKERKEYMGVMPARSEGPQYPYDTQLRLQKDQLDELGYDQKDLPRTGTEITITAKGYIKRTQVESKEKDEDSMEVCIQVTDISFSEAKDTKERKRAAKLDEIGD